MLNVINFFTQQSERPRSSTQLLLSADHASPRCGGDSSLQIKTRGQVKQYEYTASTRQAGVSFASPAAWRTNAWRICWSPSRWAWRATRPVAPPSPGRWPPSWSCSWLSERRAPSRARAWTTPWCRWRPSGSPSSSLTAEEIGVGV